MLSDPNRNEEKRALNNPVAVEIPYGSEILRLETGRMAKQANGAVFATMGETMVLATVCAEKTAVEGQDFFPLTFSKESRKSFMAATASEGTFLSILKDAPRTWNTPSRTSIFAGTGTISGLAVRVSAQQRQKTKSDNRLILKV